MCLKIEAAVNTQQSLDKHSLNCSIIFLILLVENLVYTVYRLFPVFYSFPTLVTKNKMDHWQWAELLIEVRCLWRAPSININIWDKLALLLQNGTCLSTVHKTSIISTKHVGLGLTQFLSWAELNWTHFILVCSTQFNGLF